MKNFQLGIIGAQSIHAVRFGALFNIAQRYPGFYAAYLYPFDAPERAAQVQQLSGIPSLCSSAEEILHKSDAVMVVTRRGETHYELVRACLLAGKPVFADKPFVPRPAQARELLSLAAQTGVPLLGGSTLCYLPSFVRLRRFAAQCETLLLRYKADPDSPFGGYAYYGSHLSDLCAALLGSATRVFSLREGGAVTSTAVCGRTTVTLQSTPDFGPPRILIAAGRETRGAVLNEETCYAAGTDAFVRALRSGRAPDMERLYHSVCLLDAIERSLRSGTVESVGGC